MNGKFLMSGMLSIAVIFGIGLWYSQNNAYYHDVTATEVNAFGATYPVTDYVGIDADTSPLKMRACFHVDWDYAPNDTYRTEAEPLVAPSWFDCFDAGQLSSDIKSGAATAQLADLNQPFGFSRFIVQYPDGRAFMWRQLNKCGSAEFSGATLPDGCDKNATGLGDARDGTFGQGAARSAPPNAVQQQVANLPAPVSDPAQPPKQTPTADVVVAGVQPKKPADPSGVSAPPVVQPNFPALLPDLQDLSDTITLVPLIGAAPEEIDATQLHAKADARQPLSYHGCFVTDYSFGLLTETFQVAEPAQASQIPGGLACFDAEQINEDLRVGTAVAFWGVRNVLPGVDRVVAIYDNGSAFVWQQKNENYAE